MTPCVTWFAIFFKYLRLGFAVSPTINCARNVSGFVMDLGFALVAQASAGGFWCLQGRNPAG